MMKLCASLSAASVRDAGAMYGFGFGADHTGRVVGNRFVVYRRAGWTWERCIETICVVGLVHYEANDIVFSHFLVKLDGIEEFH